jgi:hypothetical protein
MFDAPHAHVLRFVDDDPLAIYQKVLAGKIGWPKYFTEPARDLIKQLLTADLSKRIGARKSGVEEIKRHPWFAGVDWTAVYDCQVRPVLLMEDWNHGFPSKARVRCRMLWCVAVCGLRCASGVMWWAVSSDQAALRARGLWTG